MRNWIGVLFAAPALVALSGCGPAGHGPVTLAGGAPTTSQTKGSPPEATAPGDPAVFRTTLAAVGLDASAIDRGADPCQDFHQFACGGWMSKTQIPPDEAFWLRGYSEMLRRVDIELRRILEEASRAANPDPVRKTIGDYYAACMDEAAAEAAGTKPIEGMLAEAKAIQDPKSIGALVTKLHALRIFPLFDISGEQDFGDATQMIATLDQSGLGLWNRDSYLDDDDKSRALRTEYTAHVERMMALAGYSERDAKQAAKDVMSLETEIARISKSRIERREPKGMYNKLTRQGLAKAAPAMPWDDYFKSLGIGDVKNVNVTSIPFFEGMDRLFKSVKMPVWRHYFAWTIVRSTAPLLSKAFVDESFKLDAALTGRKENRPRWKRCASSTDENLGELLAQPFVQANFSGDSKRTVEDLVHRIRAAFAEEVKSLDWMDAKTRARALEKLGAMAYLIGYPSKWRTYDFPVDRRTYAANVLAGRAFEQKRKLARIGKPVNREEFLATPQTVDAFYDPQKNHMLFLAGSLQPPFYSAKAALPVNFGALGVIVGHELSHGFDDQGSQFAANGNLENWWEPAAREQFNQRANCVIEQYGAYQPLPGVSVNGKLTLGENIADMGGVKLAFAAFRAARMGATEVQVADGFTEEQQFFLAHAQAWCAKLREEATRLIVQIDAHSPPQYRVTGPLRNMPEFGKAFSCAPGTPMRPAKTCAVW